MDGTFDSFPLQFAQVYTVHAFQNGRNVVCCYALLPNKQGAAYVELLTEIQRLTNNAVPTKSQLISKLE